MELTQETPTTTQSTNQQPITSIPENQRILRTKRGNYPKIHLTPICLTTAHSSAGANSHTKAEEWLENGKAFVFVFEIGAEFNSTGKKGRPAMHVELQNFVVKKVL